MLTEDDESAELLSEGGGHETRVVEESVDVTLVSSVKDDGTGVLVEVGLVDEIAHLVSGRSCTMVGEMINSGVVVVFLGVQVALDLDIGLDVADLLGGSPGNALVDVTHASLDGDSEDASNCE